MVVELGYLGSISRKLEFLRAVNEIASRHRRIGSARARRIPNFGRIQLGRQLGQRRLQLASVKLTKRFSAGFSLLSSYTCSKSMDDSSGIRVQGQDTLFPQNSYCRKCEWALSAFDTRHRFVTSALWDCPSGRGRKVDVKNGS